LRDLFPMGRAPDSAFRNNGFRGSSIFAAIIPGAAGALCASAHIRRNVAAVACAQCRGAVLGHATPNRVPFASHAIQPDRFRCQPRTLPPLPTAC
jgi:hypothetical protein